MTDTILVILTIISVATFFIFCLLVEQYIKGSRGKRNQSSSQDLTNMGRQAKADAQEKIERAVAREITTLQKTLQSQSETIGANFAKNLQSITTQQLEEFKKTMDLADTNMKKQAEMVASQGQQQAKDLQQSLTDEQLKIKQKVLNNTDQQIAEIMISYLAEVAGDLDYQQQKDYLYSSIEANKDAIKKDITNAV
ncbi:hypothetical protein EXS66_02615 [Candidatus Saccharibacteria bacterium]|nr:hypothetical protein [Candidatus Saccharibacteria bacterium]